MLLEQATELHLVFYGSKNLAGGHVIEVYESAVPKCRQYIGGLNASLQRRPVWNVLVEPE